MSEESVPDQKAHLRSLMRDDLARVSSALAARAGEAIDSLVRSTSVWRSASQVTLFASLPGEVDTRRLMNSAVEDGKMLLLPRALRGGRLEFAQVERVESLVRGRFDLLEPGPECPVVAVATSALLLVPGMAFDRLGGRLGRGAGYYDRTLAGFRGVGSRPVCLGLGLALQIVERVPMTSLDERIDGFVTEEEFWWVA